MKKTVQQELLLSCLETVRKEFGAKITFLKENTAQKNPFIPEVPKVTIKFEQGPTKTYLIEIKPDFQKVHLAHILSIYAPYLDRNEKETESPRVLVLSKYINPQLGHQMRIEGVQFVDLCGNMYLRLGKKIVHFVLAHKPAALLLKKSTAGSAFHFAGSKVLYALLINPKKKPTVRQLAAQANVGFSTAAMALRDLTTQGLISVSKDKIVIHSHKTLLEKWVLSYSTYLRPKISVGFYRFKENDMREFLSNLTKAVHSSQLNIAITGDFAAEYYTKHLLGGKVCVFLDREYLSLPPKDPVLMLTGQPEGIEILNYFCSAISYADVPANQSFQEKVEYAHPLLVYAELLHSGGERQVEAASVLYDKHIRKIFEE